MLKLILTLFFFLLLSLYLFVDIENVLYYRHLKVTIFSFVFSGILYLFYYKVKNHFKIIIMYKKINLLIDRYFIYLLLILFFTFINFVVFSKHLNYHSYGFDLGIFDQVVYKYSNGIFPASSSIREISNVEADHFHPILALYALTYKIYASPLVLLFIQNLAFTLGGLGIYKIAKFKLNIPIIGFLLVFLYLIFRGNINALLFDFHPLVVAVSFFPWLFYFSIRKKWVYYFLLLIPILLSKENLSIYILFFGIYQFFVQKDRWIGILSFVIGGTYFYLAMNYFLPFMGGGGKYWSYDAIGGNPKELILNTFLHPIEFIKVLFSSETKVITYLHHLGSGLYIALFSPIMILLIPAYAQKFLSSREEFWTLNFHYSIDIFWIFAVSIIFIFSYINNRQYFKDKGILLFLTVFIFTNSIIINLYKSPIIKYRYGYNLENKEDLNFIIKSLPKDIKLSTQNAIVPHFSHLDDIYIFPDLGNSDYILLNNKIGSIWPLQSRNEFYFYIQRLIDKKEFKNIKMPYIKEEISFNSKYELIINKNSILLFKKIK